MPSMSFLRGRPWWSSIDFARSRLSAWRGPPHSLLTLEDKLVDRLAGRRLDREVARILGMAPEIALRDELEAGRFNFMPQRSLFDPVQQLANRRAVARFRGMISNHELDLSAGPRRCDPPQQRSRHMGMRYPARRRRPANRGLRTGAQQRIGRWQCEA